MTELIQETPDKKSIPQRISAVILKIKRYDINVLLLGISVVLFQTNLKDEPFSVPAAVVAVICFIAAGIIRVAFEWERVPILRLGKFHRTRGPGIFIVIPFLDIIVSYVDTRIIVTDFSGGKVLTKDAVPVYVDAIIFWMIWNAKKAKLEVEQYEVAVPLSAKTALRDIIGRTPLSVLLTEREEIGRELQKILDQKTNAWGITSLSVEIKDIVIPQELEDAISKEAQAEREKNARIILSDAEAAIAQKYAEAAIQYKDNPDAMHLRSLNILMETLKKAGSMILVPSDVPHLMNKGMSAAVAKVSAAHGEGTISAGL